MNITYIPFFQLLYQTIYVPSTITTSCMTMLPTRMPIVVPRWFRLWQLLRTRGELGKEHIMIRAENVDICKSAICYLRPMVTSNPFPSALMDSYSHDEQATGCLPGQWVQSWPWATWTKVSRVDRLSEWWYTYSILHTKFLDGTKSGRWLSTHRDHFIRKRHTISPTAVSVVVWAFLASHQ